MTLTIQIIGHVQVSFGAIGSDPLPCLVSLHSFGNTQSSVRWQIYMSISISMSMSMVSTLLNTTLHTPGGSDGLRMWGCGDVSISFSLPIGLLTPHGVTHRCLVTLVRVMVHVAGWISSCRYSTLYTLHNLTYCHQSYTLVITSDGLIMWDHLLIFSTWWTGILTYFTHNTGFLLAPLPWLVLRYSSSRSFTHC